MLKAYDLSRDEEIPGNPSPALLFLLRRIYNGQTLPEVVGACSFHLRIQSKAARYPIADQRLLAGGDSLRVVAWEDGEYTHRMIRPFDMTPAQLAQVFGSDRLLDERGQVALLESKKNDAHIGQGKVVDIKVDKKAHRIHWAAGAAVSLTHDQLLDYAKQVAR